MKKIFFLFYFLCSTSFLLVAKDTVSLVKVATGLTKPVLVTHCSDSRLFIVEQAGKIKVLENGTVSSKLFLNITDRVNSRNNEQGLLGLAFHPRFKENGFIYVNYTATGENRTVISRFSLNVSDSTKIDSTSEQVLLTIAQPFNNHNGGNIVFGKDGYLYIGMGDGGSGGDPMSVAQNYKSLLGKMLRIDVDTSSSYKVPKSNPYYNDSEKLPEIWSIGLRNPWRFSFDRLNGDLWIGDVGQGIWEEIDYTPGNSKGGENYGWSCYEGFVIYKTEKCVIPNAKYIDPIYAYNHSNGNCSVTGGHVYRGNPCSNLYGKYFYGDFCSGNIWTIEKNSKDSFINSFLIKMASNQLSSFGEDAKGELYICSFGPNSGTGAGFIYQIVDQNCNISISSKIFHESCLGKKNGEISITDNETNLCAFTYSWKSGQSTKKITNLEAGEYSLEVSNGTCAKNFNFEVKRAKEDSICLTPLFVDEICMGDSALIIACDKPKANYLWLLNGIIDSSLSGQRVFVKKSGSYQVKTIDSLACESKPSESVSITVHPTPARPTLSRSLDTLSAPTGYSSYIWYKDGNLIASSQSNLYIVDVKGEYCVQVIDSNQCRSECSESVTVIPTSIFNLNLEKPAILPNPGTGNFVFICGDWINADAELNIYNIDGKLCVKYFINPSLKILDINLINFTSGSYYYSIQDKLTRQKIAVGTFVKI
ncbi:MAG: PQQ-dependent sugar dehydrogenase [Saprospiraceae bacterium]|nr:PQQ-dependent sugar dehydrogenase [Saprospiraceae bacterium]